MARPKDVKLGATGPPRMSQAFEIKSQQEQEKLHLKVECGLSEDLLSLFEQELHTDLIVTDGSCEVRAHHCILQSRAQHLWKESLVFSTTDNEGSEVKGISVKGLSEKEIRDFLRQLYCVNDSELLFKEFLPFFDQPSHSEAAMETSIQQCSSSLIEQIHSEPLTSKEIGSDQHRIDTNDIKIDCNDHHLTGIQIEFAIETQSDGVAGSNVLFDSPYASTFSECQKESQLVGNDVVSDPQDMPYEEHKRDNQSLTLDELKETCPLAITKCDTSLLNKAFCTSNWEEAQVKDNDDKNNDMQNVVSTSSENNGIEIKQKINESTENSTNASHIITQSSDSTTDRSYVDLYKTCSSLGSDLLFMYVQRLHCDCCLSVEGVQFLAHKCVLSARSPYFNAMFRGQWSESNLEVVHLEGVSATALEKVLLFFYGGVMDIIASSDIVELFIIADMYGVETMKLMLQFALKKDMCHLFHKPCSTCTARAPEALNLCHNFHLEELQERLLKWISKYFTKFWCTKAFASLPESVHQLCVKAVVSQMREDNVLDIIMDCDKLTKSLPRIKWTESTLCLTTQLMDLAIEYTSTNFIKVIHTPEFLTWAKIASWKASALEDIFTSVIDSLPMDTAISVYQTLIELKAQETLLESPEQNLLDLLDTMIKRCEKFLRTHISLVTRSKQWSSISRSLQSKILENSSYLHLDHFPDPKPCWEKPKPKFRSSALSSITSSSSRASRWQGASSALGQRPTQERVFKNTTSKESNGPGKSTVHHPNSKCATHSGLTSNPLKASRSSTKQSTKATLKMKHIPEGRSDRSQSPKGCASGGINHKEGSYSQTYQHPDTSKQKLNRKNQSVSPGKSFSRSPSHGHSSLMWSSPPSRIHVKTVADNNTIEQSLARPQNIFVTHDDTTEVDEAENSCEDLTHATKRDSSIPVTTNHLPFIKFEGNVEEVSEIIAVNETSMDTHIEHCDSVNPQGCSDNALEYPESCIEPKSGQSHESSAVSSSSPVRSDPLQQDFFVSSSYGTHGHDHVSGSQLFDEIQHGHSVTVDPLGMHDAQRDHEVYVQQETNFVRVVQPVKVSFVVPCEQDELS